MLVTVIAEFNAKTTNSEKAIYFLSLMSCSMDKLKSHMFFACKNFFFFLFYVEKNILIQKMAVGRGRAGGPLPPFPIALNTLIDNAEDLDIFMPIYNLLEYSQNYSMTSESLWNFYCCYFVY